MVKVYGMVHSASLVENGHSSRLVALPKFKRRKVSAIRDFPPRCGRAVRSVDNRSMKTMAPSVGNHENNEGLDGVYDALEADFSKPLGNEVDPQSKEMIHDASKADAAETLGHEFESQCKEKFYDASAVAAARCLETVRDSEPKDMFCHALGIDASKALGNGDDIHSPSRENCLASDIDAAKTSKTEVDSELKEDSCKVPEMNAVKEAGSEVDPETTEALKNLIPMDMPGMSKSLESEKGKAVPLNDGEKSVNVECLERTLLVVSDHEGLVKPSKDLEYRGSQTVLESTENVDGLKIKAEVAGKGTSRGGRHSVFSSVDKRLRKNYPPRRRISAVRDFPPLCGAYALHLGKEQCRGAFTSSNKSSSSAGKIGVVKTYSEATVEKIAKPQHIANLHVQGQKPLRVYKRSITDIEAPEKQVRRQVSIHTKEKNLSKNISKVFDSENQFQLDHPTALGSEPAKVIVQGLMAAPFCPWRKRKGSLKPNLSSGASGIKMKKAVFIEKEKKKSVSKMLSSDHIEVFGDKHAIKELTPDGRSVHKDRRHMPLDDVGGSSEDSEGHGRYQIVQRSLNSSLSLPPFGVSTSQDVGSRDASDARNKVRESLRLFQAICRKLLHENEATGRGGKNPRRRVDLVAASILKGNGKFVNIGKQIMGPVPGVEIGDEFHYRVELNIVGLHRQIQGGIDFIKQGHELLATSIVASGGYADELDDSDTLIYSGSGGNVMQGDKAPEDQKLERGNLALRNSISKGNPVRVIRGFKESKASESSDARAKVVMTYTYDGFYLVDKYWQEMGQHGKLVFKFQLNRVPGQPELAWKAVKRAKKNKLREGLCDDDISQGKEIMPICAVNVIDDEKPSPFTYIKNMKYPSWFHPNPPPGCNCVNGCFDSEKCSCATKNGGEIPYNYSGDIVEARTIVYECGKSCKCPPSCHNRVSQHGIKFQLEVFKTESRGWGVRSLNSIPSGSYICEYIGELIEDKEAEQRTGNDDYLFDIGHNYHDRTLWSGLSNCMPDAVVNSSESMEDAGFTIDAARYGNVGRFINHSCSPNLYAQNVCYDHEDKKMPHIVFFAAENIPPLQELSYHYNYTIDQVLDVNGNIKKKYCFCGSSECSGRMY